jgi:hypothetical protein
VPQVVQIVMLQPPIPVPQLKTRKVVRPLGEVSLLLVSVPDILLFQLSKLVGSNGDTLTCVWDLAKDIGYPGCWFCGSRDRC